MPNNLATEERPLRVAIIGSGPSAFYSAESLFKSGKNLIINMFERLPTPYGLVRYGVAPDHPKIKNVIKVYEKTAENPKFSFFGNVEIGKAITIHQLRKYHDALIFANGAETDRKLGIEGEDLTGSHTATEFVGWYNGNPAFQDRKFDLSCETAVIIGQGNVALDVARILTKTAEELKNTDITQNALDTLAQSKIKTVHIIGRRGPAQAAFTAVEIREFAELADCHPVVEENDLKLNYASQQEIEDPHNAPKKKNYEIISHFLELEPGNKSRRVYFHFLKSPAAIYGDEQGRINRIFLEKNRLIGEPGVQKAQGTGEKERINCGIVFRSIGYRGLPIKGLPFSDNAGVIPNTQGRVSDSEVVFPGLYTVGWIKRGPSGIIGTNKPDAEETVHGLIEDISILNPCKNPSNEQLIEFFKEKNVRFVTFAEWKKIDAAEIARGQAAGKPREKFTSIDEMLACL